MAAVETIHDLPPASAPTKKEPTSTDEGLPAANMGAFAAALAMAIGQMTNMLGVVGQNSADVTKVGAAMQEGWMAVATQQNTDAMNNLQQQEKQARHRSIFGKVFNFVTHPSNMKYMSNPVLLMAKVLSTPAVSHQLAKILPQQAVDAFSKVSNAVDAVKEKVASTKVYEVATYIPHKEEALKAQAKTFANEKIKQPLENHVLKPLEKGINKCIIQPIAFVYYHELKLIDPNMSDKVAHAVSEAMAQIAVMIAVMVLVTVATDGAADAMVGEAEAGILVEESAALGEEAAGRLGMEAGDIEMQTFGEEEAVTTGEGTAAEAAAEVSTMTSAEQQSFKRILSDMIKSQQFWETARWVETISNIVKGVEELGNSYFSARQGVLTQKYGQIQAGLENSQFALQQISQINKLNASNLKETLDDVFSDIKGLLSAEANALGAMAQGMYA